MFPTGAVLTGLLSKNLPNIQISDRESNRIILSADKIRTQRTQYRCMVFIQIGLKPVCSAKSYRSNILFSDKEATGRMVSHNKEPDQTVITQHFPACNQLTGLPSNANIKTSISNKNSEGKQKAEDYGCTAYIPILDIVETRDIILSNNICDVERHGYAGLSVLQ